MNVAKLLEKRRTQWTELEKLCDAMEVRGKTSGKGGRMEHRGAQGVARFASLYRSACADLALADSYQLPPGTVTYLHRLVARAHNQLYRASKFDPSTWVDVVFREAPQMIYSDPCVRIASIVFFGLFLLSMILGGDQVAFPGFAEKVMGESQIQAMHEMYAQPLDVDRASYIARAAWYIRHNTGIGLRCFAYGILIVPCLYTLAVNAVQLGTTFGYMSRADVEGGQNFFEFVTAHGPFELSAIALAAAAGLRLGVGLFYTNGLTRMESVRENGRRAVPIMSASAVLFILAAFTEGFLSPSGAPYSVKAAWAIISSGMISVYFVVLGFPRDEVRDGYSAQSGTYDSLFRESETSSENAIATGASRAT